MAGLQNGDAVSLRSFEVADLQDLTEPSKSTSAFIARYHQADKDLEALYNIIDAASISEFTLEMLEEMEKQIKALHVSMQVTKKHKRGRGKKKTKESVPEAWEEKKKQNMGQRFLQWLSRSLSCCSCVDVRF